MKLSTLSIKPTEYILGFFLLRNVIISDTNNDENDTIIMIRNEFIQFLPSFQTTLLTVPAKAK